ncbi:hypothetical protein [uncultured Erythrobacter sp.]|uniref:hypothetical protein n=1 Tax=uncultured Erythrobacter sp. TaxID=263913 RepID=UPI002601EE14|nr:hypothetical protein [uncultured Erythrobacter sp.]
MLDEDMEDGDGPASEERAEEDLLEEGGEEEEGDSEGGAASGMSLGFLGSVKGIITACTGMIVAIGGLITVLSNSGVIGEGGGAKEEQEYPADPDAPADVPDMPDPEVGEDEAELSDAVGRDETPADTSRDATETRMFVVVSRSDGWAAVRSRPTIGSTMLDRLETGDFVRCGRTIPDAADIPNRNWRYCPEVEGHVAASLLRRVRN